MILLPRGCAAGTGPIFPVAPMQSAPIRFITIPIMHHNNVSDVSGFCENVPFIHVAHNKHLSSFSRNQNRKTRCMMHYGNGDTENGVVLVT